MANITIADLQPADFEFAELSELEMKAILGGGWFHDLTGIRTPSPLRRLDDWVRGNVPEGWIGVIKIIIKGGGGRTPNALE